MSSRLLVKKSVALAALVAFTFSARGAAGHSLQVPPTADRAAGAGPCGYWCSAPADPPGDPASLCGYWCQIAPNH